MKFALSIDCDNAAFDGSPAEEVANVLTYLAACIAQSDTPRREFPADPFILRDSNGNRVGEASFTA